MFGAGVGSINTVQGSGPPTISVLPNISGLFSINLGHCVISPSAQTSLSINSMSEEVCSQRVLHLTLLHFF
jgi:hypothetical protein